VNLVDTDGLLVPAQDGEDGETRLRDAQAGGFQSRGRKFNGTGAASAFPDTGEGVICLGRRDQFLHDCDFP
jgi:hypothetical protein